MALQVSKLHLALLTIFSILFNTAYAEELPRHEHSREASSNSQPLVDEITELRAKVVRLEAALERNHKASSETGASGQKSMKMGGHDRMKGMNMMKKNSGMKKMMMKGGMMSKMKGMMSGKMGMGMMGHNPTMKSSSMSGMNKSSSLPGFPGISHLYHIGETGFFLDHPQHITLTDKQKQQLNKIKDSALLSTATAERKIEEAEQQLWTLTAEAEPDIEKIETKVKKIAQIGVENRIAFIRSVGEAARVLTEIQRHALIGKETISSENHNHASQ